MSSIYIYFLLVLVLVGCALNLHNSARSIKYYQVCLHRQPEKPQPQSDSLPSLAYGFNGYRGDMWSIPAALAAVFHPRNTYGVLVDASVTKEEVDELRRLIVEAVLNRTRISPEEENCADVLCVEARLFVTAGEFSVTYAGITEPLATIDLIAMLLDFDTGWEFLINLSPLDYPLASQNDISGLLSSARGYNFVGTSRTGYAFGNKKIENRWHQINYDPSLLRVRDGSWDKQQLVKLPVRLPSEITDSPHLRVFQAESFGILSRSFCRYAVNSPLSRHAIALLSHGRAPSEQLLPTLIGNSEQFGHCPSNLRMNNAASGPFIELTNARNIKDTLKQLAQTGLLFARKFPRACTTVLESPVNCTQAYAREPVRNAVFEHLVRGNINVTHPGTNHTTTELRQIWRGAASEKLRDLLRRCRHPSVSVSSR